MREELLDRYEEVYNAVMLEPGGLYMQQQFKLDAAVFHQAEQGKKIVVPREYPRNLKLIIGRVQW